MTYKISYLSNADKIKITNELFYQLKKWEMEEIILPETFIDELKSQDNEWINNNRSYYSHNVQLNQQGEAEILLRSDSRHRNPVVNKIITQEKLHQIYKILQQCTGRQRRRFILHFFYGYSFSDIALQEAVSRNTVRRSIQKARKLIKSMNIL